MSVRTVALPARVLRRWDAIAAEQLCQRAAELDSEKQELQRRLRCAENNVDQWHQAALVDDVQGVEGLFQTREYIESASHA